MRYTTTDRAGNSATLSRQIRVLLPDGDEDGDGYTNQEEILGGSDPFDTNSQPTDTEAPTATYTLTPATLTGGSVGVVLYASEPIRALSGWSLLLPRQTGSEF
ncbi:hypothetical protein FACS1894176_01330 [Bacteroidia bacterium]|nr:hypothetical protein FACS189428_7000 [Clostridia bacterium]GHV24621.1 hypothetical protein FACS1894176_01330 [Bacteroidia bacterium]